MNANQNNCHPFTNIYLNDRSIINFRYNVLVLMGKLIKPCLKLAVFSVVILNNFSFSLHDKSLLC